MRYLIVMLDLDLDLMLDLDLPGPVALKGSSLAGAGAPLGCPGEW